MGISVTSDKQLLFRYLMDQHQAIVLLLDEEVVAQDNFRKLADHLVHQARFEYKLVFPILLEPCQWDDSSLKYIPVYPLNKEPISKWTSDEVGWQQVLEEIWAVLKPYSSFYSESPRLTALRSIGRVSVGREQTFVSGFLINNKPYMLLTSILLIDSEEKAREGQVTFTDAGGLSASFKLLPERFFLMDVETGVLLVGVDENPLHSDYQTTRTIANYYTLKLASEQVRPGDLLDATNFERVQKISANQQIVEFADDEQIRFNGPLVPGTSGGPLLNEQLEVVAVNPNSRQSAISLGDIYEKQPVQSIEYEEKPRSADKFSALVPTIGALFRSIDKVASTEQRDFFPNFNWDKTTTKLTQPLVALCYFTQSSDRNIHLKALEEEHERIQLASERNQLSSSPIPVQYILRSSSVANSGQLVEDIRLYSDRIVLFQFSGNTYNRALLLNDNISQIGSVSELLGQYATNLNVVVLNGCSTNVMVESLFNQGIPVVVGINDSISDRQAMEFSVRFHEGILRRLSIINAFNQSVSFLKVRSESTINERGMSIPNDRDKIGLYTNNKVEDLLNASEWWKISYKSNQLLYSSPKLSPLSSTWQYNGNNILVVGTGNYELTEIEAIVSQAIGHMLAIGQYGLIGGGWPGVDHIVGKAYTSELASKGISEKLYYTQVVYDKPDYEGGTTVPVKTDSEWYDEAISRADAVIMIGGLDGTYTTYKRAKDMHIPVIPIATTDGGARRAYHREEKSFMTMYSKNQELCQLFARLDNPALGGTQIAEIVKSMLKNLLFEIQTLKSTSKRKKK